MYEIYDFCYRVRMSCGGDAWTPYGLVMTQPRFGHFHLSAPVFFDKETMILRTFSGSVYHINTFDGNPEKIIAEIEKDIERVNVETINLKGIEE